MSYYWPTTNLQTITTTFRKRHATEDKNSVTLKKRLGQWMSDSLVQEDDIFHRGTTNENRAIGTLPLFLRSQLMELALYFAHSHHHIHYIIYYLNFGSTHTLCSKGLLWSFKYQPINLTGLVLETLHKDYLIKNLEFQSSISHQYSCQWVVQQDSHRASSHINIVKSTVV